MNGDIRSWLVPQSSHVARALSPRLKRPRYVAPTGYVLENNHPVYRTEAGTSANSCAFQKNSMVRLEIYAAFLRF